MKLCVETRSWKCGKPPAIAIVQPVKQTDTYRMHPRACVPVGFSLHSSAGKIGRLQWLA
jgi:hypothetical protein